MRLQIVGETVADLDEKPNFGAFWLLYPKKVAKFDAEKAWKKLSEADQLAAIVGLVPWRRVWMQRGELQYVPHAATWLNGHRWEDELPEQWAQGAAHASHAPAVLPETGRSTEMPAHVRAALAKLRK